MTGLSRTVSDIYGDFGWTTHIFPTLFSTLAGGVYLCNFTMPAGIKKLPGAPKSRL